MLSPIRSLLSAITLLSLAWIWFSFRTFGTGLLPSQLCLLNPDTNVIAVASSLTGVALALFLLSIPVIKTPASAQLAGVVSSMSFGTAAWVCTRFDYTNASTALWWLCILVAIITTKRWASLILIRDTIRPVTDQSCENTQLSDGYQDRTNVSSLQWVCLLAVMIITSIAYVWRLTEVPQYVRSYGLRGFFSAHLFLSGLLPIESLVLFREMTQEECGYSLPFVLWHSLFQQLPGGMSLFNARLACASAVWLSLLFMFRVGRRLFGSTFALLSLVVYASLPVTFFDARHEGIFGFSSLLFLICSDAALSFIANPSRLRAILLGLTLPLLGYGIANIKLMSLAIFATLVLVLIKDAQFRSHWRRILLAASVSMVLLLPQLMNWRTVTNALSGRGEHLLGRNFKHMISSDPLQRGYWYHVQESLTNNISNIASTLFKHAHDEPVTHLSLLSPLVLIGLTMCLTKARNHAYFFIITLTAGAYAALLVAVPASEERMMLLGIPQTFLIATLWLHLYRLLSKQTTKPVAVSITVIIVTAACTPGLAYALQELRTPTEAGTLGTVMARRGHNRIVFYSHDHETILNTLRLNFPTFGRDSSAKTPIIGMPPNGNKAFREVAEELALPAILINRRQDDTTTGIQSNWQREEIQASRWERWHILWNDAQTLSHKFIVKSLLSLSDVYQDPTIQVRDPYSSPTLRERNIPSKWVEFPFELDGAYQSGAICVQNSNSYSPAVEVTVDGNPVNDRQIRQGEPGKEVVWFLTKQLSPGKHTVAVRRPEQAAEAWVSEIVFIGSSY